MQISMNEDSRARAAFSALTAGVVSQAFSQSTLPPDYKMGRQTLEEVHSHTLAELRNYPRFLSLIHSQFFYHDDNQLLPNILNC